MSDSRGVPVAIVGVGKHTYALISIKKEPEDEVWKANASVVYGTRNDHHGRVRRPRRLEV